MFATLGVAHSYFYGLLIGHALLVFLARYRTRLQLAGVLLQVLLPVLLIALATRILLSLPRNTGADPAGWWWILLALSISTAGIFWAVPYGKKLSWQGSWSFPYPLTTPPKPTQVAAKPAVNLQVDSGQPVQQSRHHAGESGTRARARTPGAKDDAQQSPRYALLPGQSPFKGGVMWLAGWLCCLVALGLSFWGTHHLLTTPVSSTSGFFAILAMTGVAALDQSRKLFLRGRRHLKLPIASPNVLRPGSYVLYLRSFEDDKARTALQKQLLDHLQVGSDATGGLIGLVTSSRDEEEHIADALRPIGPMVAVGAPGEILPFAGAVRMYLPKTSWQQPVRQLMERSRLVTLTLGSSAGTLWELSEAMRILPPQRLLLLVPGMMHEEEYETIRTKNETALRALPESRRNPTWKDNAPPSLPDCASYRRFVDPVIGVIHFSSDWEPAFTRTPATGLPYESLGTFPWENLCTSLIRGLRPTFEQLVAHEEETGWHCG
ncbi:hypothetical protein [Streptomyces sp. NPDC058964]|uniref:hypothetical protein n=1 Tax=Streptomyces sp. NPDC058964 TaxID=3346681 RepID=UPI003698C4D1